MSNTIKYSEGSESLALNKGNWWVGTGDSNKGPTVESGYWNAINPPDGGYTVYLNKETNGPSIHSITNDENLISFTNKISGNNYTTVAECLVYYQTQDDKLCVNREYENIVTDGLVLNLDAGYAPSYPTSGTTWYDLSGGGNDGTLTNGPVYDSGSIVFDGTDDFILGNIPSSTFSNASTICCWFKRDSLTHWSGLFSNNVNTTSCAILTFISNSNIIGTNQAGINANYIGIDLGNDYLGKWIYCVLVYNGSTNGSTVNVYSYKDDSLTTSSGSLYWNLSTGSQYYVGRHWTTVVQIHDGPIPITQVYNRALSATEILQNYNATKSRFGL